MLYMTGDVTIIVLESGNLEALKKGRPAKSPDGKVVICWTPDPVWLAEQIAKSDGDGAIIGRLIDESLKRQEKPTRPFQETTQTEFKRPDGDGETMP
jgi:hypothetical protein